MPCLRRISAAVSGMHTWTLFASCALLVSAVAWSQHDMRSQLHRVAKDAEPILDSQVFYSAAGANRTLESFGIDGRRVAFVVCFLDFLLTPGYGLGLAMAVTALYRPFPALAMLNLLPLFSALVDFAENICIMFLLFKYPGQGPLQLVGHAAGVLTALKTVAFASSVIATLVGLIAWPVGRFLLGRSSTPQHPAGRKEKQRESKKTK